MRIPRRNDTREPRNDRRSLVTVAVMVGGILAVALAGPAVADRVSTELEQPAVDALVETPSIGSTPDVAPQDEPAGRPAPGATTPTTSSPPALPPPALPPPTTDTAPPTTAATPETTPPTTATTTAIAESVETDESDDADPSPLRTIQLVPALRDVIVMIDGSEYASDEDGVISIGPTEPGATFEFVGVRATPSLRSVAFGRWADGSPDSSRALAEIDGPSTQIGILLSHRVTVSAQQSVPDGALLVAESEAGSLRLEIGRTAWVPASRAVETADGLIEQRLTYEVNQLAVAGDTTGLDVQVFEPTPEALWVVDVSG